MLSSWKNTFEVVHSELELANRKKQALDELLAKNRMSQPTYEHLVGGLNENIADLESHQKSLMQKMTERVTSSKTKQSFSNCSSRLWKCVTLPKR